MSARLPVIDQTLFSQTEQDIMVSRFAPYFDKHRNLSVSHKHTFYHLVLFTEGCGTHVIDFETFEVRPYQMYFMVPGQVHSWNFGGHVDGFVVNFSPGIFHNFLPENDFLRGFPFFSGSAIDSVVDLPGDSRSRITALFENLLEENSLQNEYGNNVLKLLLAQLFLLVDRHVPEGKPGNPSSYNNTLFNTFQDLLGQNYRLLKLPRDYASMMHITPNHLNAVCNHVVGLSAGEIIRARVMLEAKRLLVDSSVSVSAIADTLNFADNSYFTKYFKKYSGQTPEEFRNLQSNG